MELNLYLTLAAVPSMFLGFAWIITLKDLMTGIVYLGCTTAVYALILILIQRHEKTICNIENQPIRRY